MKKYHLLLLLTGLLMFQGTVFGQGLTKDRIDILRQSVVRISIDSTSVSGTGFFIDNKGTVLTCWHVIVPALSATDNPNIYKVKSIFIENASGQKCKVVPVDIENASFFLYDYCRLQIVEDCPFKYKPLKVASFNAADEGDVVYTAGYPLGIDKQVIAVGTISTKFIADHSWPKTDGTQSHYLRKEAWLDLTLNRGNSGGPIIRKGKSAKKDVVIGIADYILSPAGQSIEQLNFIYRNNATGTDLIEGGISRNKVLAAITQALMNCSIGVSACVAIDYSLMK